LAPLFLCLSPDAPPDAIVVAGACGVSLRGGFSVWELICPLLAAPVAYLALRSYRFIGLAWLMHAAWDLAHHLWGNPIWPFMRTSSFGCMIFDTLIAIWFLAGAPALTAHVWEAAAKFKKASVP
jgi:hypothetical protein